jgi:hypothetical protein
VTVRRRETVRFGIAFVWALPVLFFGYFALAPDTPTGQRAAYGVIAALFAVLMFRTVRIGVATGPGGVVVRGITRSWRLPWEEVERFEMGTWRGPGNYPCGIVRRRDGSQITVLALNPPFELQPGQDQRVPELLAELNAELEARRVPQGS